MASPSSKHKSLLEEVKEQRRLQEIEEKKEKLVKQGLCHGVFIDFVIKNRKKILEEFVKERNSKSVCMKYNASSPCNEYVFGRVKVPSEGVTVEACPWVNTGLLCIALDDDD